MVLLLLVVPACGKGGESQTSSFPQVHLIATGGTIGGAGYKTDPEGGNELLQAIPGLASIAKVTAEDPFTIASSQMTPKLIFELVERIRTVFAERPNLSGIVVTHGTDSLEETAFLFDLLLDFERPVVVTGAMRTREKMGADGTRNLLNAVRLAGEPAARGLGVLVTLNDEVHSAREVRKMHSSALDAFESPGVGRLGYFDDGMIFLLHKPLRRLHITAKEIEPKVDLIVATVGSDGHQVRGAVQAGAKGIVLELFGRGNAPRGLKDAVADALRAGVTVVYASRTRRGGLKEAKHWATSGILSVEDLGGIKARLVLVAALGTTKDTATLQGYFDRLAGKVGS